MKNKFEGYFFKQQRNNDAIAVIVGRGSEEAFIQVITEDQSYHVKFDLEQYYRDGIIKIGKNKFSKKGIILDIQQDDLTLSGTLKFNQLSPLKKDIMGPLKRLPLECRHVIVSMRHSVSGVLTLNGREINLTGGTGYIEGDRGSSFPTGYSWAQSNVWENQQEDCAVVTAAAKIPLAGMRFWGCFAAISYQGEEYRLATYKGAKILSRTSDMLIISQGKLRLTVMIPHFNGQMLYAPTGGAMRRTVHESIVVRARFIFEKDNEVLFDLWSHGAGYEYV